MVEMKHGCQQSWLPSLTLLVLATSKRPCISQFGYIGPLVRLCTCYCSPFKPIQFTASCCNRRAETCPTYTGRRPLHHMEGSHPLWQFLPVPSTVPWRWFFNACCNLKSAVNGLVAGCNTPQWQDSRVTAI